jgi:hypothetical protein
MALLPWLYCHGFIAMALLPWLYCHGFIAIVLLPWLYCHGFIAMALLPWLYCHGFFPKGRPFALDINIKNSFIIFIIISMNIFFFGSIRDA